MIESIPAAQLMLARNLLLANPELAQRLAGASSAAAVPPANPGAVALLRTPEAAAPDGSQVSPGFAEKLAALFDRRGQGEALQPVQPMRVPGRFFGDTVGGVSKAQNDFAATQGQAISARNAALASLLNTAEQTRAAKENADAARSQNNLTLMTQDKLARDKMNQDAELERTRLKLLSEQAENMAEIEKKKLDLLAKESNVVPLTPAEAAAARAKEAQKPLMAEAIAVANREFPKRLKSLADTYEAKWATGLAPFGGAGDDARAAKLAGVIRVGDLAQLDNEILDPENYHEAADLKMIRDELLKYQKAAFGAFGTDVIYDNASKQFKLRGTAAVNPVVGPSALMVKSVPITDSLPGAGGSLAPAVPAGASLFGLNPGMVLPLPVSADMLQPGMRYQTARGVATWDGTGFVQ